LGTPTMVLVKRDLTLMVKALALMTDGTIHTTQHGVPMPTFGQGAGPLLLAMEEVVVVVVAVAVAVTVMTPSEAGEVDLRVALKVASMSTSVRSMGMDSHWW
jgi:hypothetical protein